MLQLIRISTRSDLNLDSKVFRGIELNLQKKVIRVAIIGVMKAVKSIFLNTILDSFVMPAMDKRCTCCRFILRNPDESGNGTRSI